MRPATIAVLAILRLLVPARQPFEAQQPELAFDHVWLVVAPGAPERAVLERAGFRIAPAVNRHDGQGTASITVEFDNAFLELLWPDSSVPVTPSRAVAAERFRRRAAWRTSGWSPVGIGLRRAAPSSDPLPFPTWRLGAEWRAPGDSLEMMTARGDSLDPSIWIVARSTVTGKDTSAQALHDRTHGLGVHRITHVRVTGPQVGRSPPTAYLNQRRVVEFAEGPDWLVELTFDGGTTGDVTDLRPLLPLLLRR